MKPCKYIVVHCSDSPNSRVDRRYDGAPEIHAWHVERGWSGIGYHYVINEDGRVQSGRPVWLDSGDYWTGSHVRGHNGHSIGICMVGEDHYHAEQLDALSGLIDQLREVWPQAQVVGHYQLDQAKSCPGIDVPHWVGTGEQIKTTEPMRAQQRITA